MISIIAALWQQHICGGTMQLSDGVIVAAIGASAAILGAMLGVIGAILSHRRESSKTLFETVDRRVTILLEERDKRVAELTSEVHLLREVVADLRTVLNKMYMAGARCDRNARGECPIVNANLPDNLRQAELFI